MRNNNSSRFGKWISISFDSFGSISGATMTQYLLEKSRVTGQTRTERNYHCFYQLLAGADEDQKARYRLMSPQEFFYLNQSGCYSVENMNDKEEFEDMVR